LITGMSLEKGLQRVIVKGSPNCLKHTHINKGGVYLPIKLAHMPLTPQYQGPEKNTGISPEPLQLNNPNLHHQSQGPAPVPAMRRPGVLASKSGRSGRAPERTNRYGFTKDY